MSVKGSLESVGLEDLLQADLAVEGGGRLTLRHGPHHAALYLGPDGMYVKHPDLMLPEMLIDAFVARGLVDEEAVARARRSHLHGVRLLDELVREGAMPEAEFMEVLAAEVEDTVLDMMLWEEGWFRFGREPFVPATMGLLARICVDPRGVAERAMDRLEQRREVGDLLGDHALLFIGVPGEVPPPEDDRDPIHDVYSRLDGKTVAHEIALRIGRSRFTVLRAVRRLAEAGLARPAEGSEIVDVADQHAADGRATIARHLVLQWVERSPGDEAPLLKLAQIAHDMRDQDAELDALCALGHLHIRSGDHDRALKIFTEAMDKAPADDVVLAGMRIAAEAAGDTDALLDSTLLTAQTKLDEGLADEALELIAPLRETHAANMGVHLLHARALVQAEKRQEFFQHAEAVGRVLANEGCHSNVDREAVEFFRETITHLAPDRGDLLERFRSIYDPRRTRRRKAALVTALLLVLGVTGFVFWPPSPEALLEQAQEAANDGDSERARELIGLLVQDHPDSPAAEQAILLQRRLFPPAETAPRLKAAVKKLYEKLDGKLPALTAALPQLPAETAQSTVGDFVDLLGVSAAKTLRHEVLEPQTAALRETVQRLLTDTMERVEVLAQTGDAHDQLSQDPVAMRAFMEESERARDAEWLDNTRKTAKLLHRLGRLHADEIFRNTTNELIRSVDALDKAAQYHDRAMPAVRLSFGSLQVEEADRRCREEAPALMVAGKIDRADAIYAHLETLLQEFATDPIYAPLLERVKRRQLPTFIADRRAQITEIRGRMKEAQNAEANGDLEEAVRLYADMVSTYWLIRFENVFTLPLHVSSVPSGARVILGGEVVGNTPLIVRYPWGSTDKLKLDADGYETVVHDLTAKGGVPPHAVTLSLAPRALWTAPVGADVRIPPLPVNDDLLAIDRRGKSVLYDGKTGAVRWLKTHASLEGVRGLPAFARGVLYVPQIDGHLLLLSAADGSKLGELTLPRLKGDAAAIGGRIAVMTSDGTCILIEGKRETARIALGATPAAGVVAAHGAFWIGTIDGSIVRIDAASGLRRDMRVTKNRAAIDGIGTDATGVYATTAHGSLVALDSGGGERWRHDKIGDIVGAPARAAGCVGVAARDGVVTLYDARSGRPVRRYEGVGRPRSGLLGAGPTFLLVRADGSLWACDAATGTVLVDAQAPAGALFPPAVLPGDRVALPHGKSGLGVIPSPRMPKPSAK